MPNEQMRQGDVFLERASLDVMPADFKEVPLDKGRVVLAYGEVTGHAHAIQGDAAKLFAAPKGGPVRYLRVVRETDLRHEEHGPIHLSPGLYVVRTQREYTPEAPRPVAD